MSENQMLYLLDMAGVAVFAISGALAAGRKRMDTFGVVVLALVTAVGGGTLRDLLLARPVFWVADPLYVGVGAGAALLTVATFGRIGRWRRVLMVADALGMALFAVLGAEAALAHGAHPAISIVMGMLSGVAGGIVRDVLSGEVPLVLRREIYATAALAAAAVFVAGAALALPPWLCATTGFLAGFALRTAAVVWRLALPEFHLPGTAGD